MRSSAPVTVLIPYYNNDTTLEAALASVRDQTLPPAQIIVIDDCSSSDRIAPLTRLGPTVTLLRTSRNAGPGAARNVGLAAATEPWIALLDADDAWLPEKLERQMAWLEAHPEFDGGQTGTILWRNGVDERSYRDKPPVITAEIACRDGGMLPSTSIFRTALLRDIGGWNESMPFMEDWDVTMRAVRHGARLGSLNEPLVRFRRDGHGNITQDPWTTLAAQLAAISRNRAYIESVLGGAGLLACRARCLREFGLKFGGVPGRGMAVVAGLLERRSRRQLT